MKSPGSSHFSVKNFERFQHYRKRRPPWIKLYNWLLDDHDFCALSPGDRYVYIGLLLVASRHENYVPHDPKFLAETLHIQGELDLTPLFDKRFLLACRKRGTSRPLASRKQSAMPETETESESESESENLLAPLNGGPPGFNIFWSAYPRKDDKTQARKAWERMKPHPPDDYLLGVILGNIERRQNIGQWTKARKRFIPKASTFLNNRRWEDEDLIAEEVVKNGTHNDRWSGFTDKNYRAGAFGG